MCQQHNLFLINRDTQCFLQVLLHFGEVVGDGLAPVLACDEIRNVFQWPRTVERVHGDQVVELVRFQFSQVLLHTSTFKLESTVCFTALIQFVCFRIIERNGINIYLDSVVLFDHPQGIPYDRERLQAQKVHLDNTGIFDGTAFVLGNQQIRVPGCTNGYDFRQFLGGNDDTRGVNTCSAD